MLWIFAVVRLPEAQRVMMLTSTSGGEESFALTEKQRLVQRSTLNETIAAPDENRKTRPTVRNDLLELALGCFIFVIGTYLPKPIVAMFLNLSDLITKAPPILKTKAGDFLIDLQLNEPLVDPATVSCTYNILQTTDAPTMIYSLTRIHTHTHTQLLY